METIYQKAAPEVWEKNIQVECIATGLPFQAEIL